MSVFAPRKVWTFRLSGGEPLDASVSWPYSVPTHLFHGGQGVTSLWMLFITDQEAGALVTSLESRGIHVVAWGEAETEEQRKDRDRLRHLHSDGVVFPTPRCPECFWLDVTSGDAPACGYILWPPETIRAAVATYERAVEDLQKCPALSRA